LHRLLIGGLAEVRNMVAAGDFLARSVGHETPVT
jgi:hypothetical protein